MAGGIISCVYRGHLCLYVRVVMSTAVQPAVPCKALQVVFGSLADLVARLLRRWHHL